MHLIQKKIDIVLKEYKKKASLKKMIKKCSPYMIPGWYHVEYQYEKPVLKVGAFPSKITLKNVCRMFIFGVFRIKNHNPIAECGIALCSSFDNYKFFALKCFPDSESFRIMATNNIT